MKKYFMAAWAMVETFWFGGITYGWASLVFILKKEGIYGDLCDEAGHINSFNSTKPELNSTALPAQNCPEQNEKFSLAFTVAVTSLQVCSPIMGHIQYKFGTRVTRLVLLCLLLCGSLVIAFLDTSTPYLIYIGLTCVAVGGLPVFVTNTQVANLFIVGGSTVVGILSGAMDASAAVQLIVKIAFENGVSRKISYLFMSSLQIMIVISTFLWLPKTIFPKTEVQETTDTDQVEKPYEQISEEGKGNQKATHNSIEEPDPRKKFPRLSDCLTSGIFITHIAWFSILQLRYLYFVGSLNTWLYHITDGDDDQVSYYTNVGLFIQLAAVVISPFSGFLLDLENRRHGGRRTVTERRLRSFVLLLAITSCLGLLLSALVFVPNTQVLYLDFIAATFFRSFLYGMAAAFVHFVFPAEYYGTIYGVAVAVSGLIATLQYPMFIWMETPPSDSNKVNMLLGVLTLMSFVHPVFIWLTCRTADKKALQTTNRKEESNYVFIKRRSWCCQR